MAKEDNEHIWDQKYDKYIKIGLSTENARIQTEEKKNSTFYRSPKILGKICLTHPVHSAIAKRFHSRKGYGRCKRFPVRRIQWTEIEQDGFKRNAMS